MRLHASTYDRPASVSDTRRDDRWKSCVLSRASSSDNLRLTVGTGIRSFRDAADRLPASAMLTATAISSTRSIDAVSFGL